MDEKIRFSGWAAWLDGDSIWWCQDEHSGSAPMQPRTGFEEDMLDEIRRLRTELVECRAKHMDDLLVLGETAKAERELRAELATEHKRQSAMRTLIASLEGQLMHYRSKQAEADEAVRTLDSERAANATLTAELAECKEDAERYRWLRNRIPGSAYRIAGIIYSEGGAGVAAIDAARKGEGG